MPKRVFVTRDNMHWLHTHHARTTYAEMARKLHVNVDTLKRILVREGLREFDGAKYQLARDNDVPQWERACIKCGATTRRPKGWYFCKSCRHKQGWDIDE